MPHCYILFSEKLNRFYTGATQSELDERLLKHNEIYYNRKNFTANADDWTLFLSIEVESYAHAIRLERKIKSMKSSNYIRNLKLYPELQSKIISQTST